MDVLKDRCLISISEHMVEMHDLIQEMGHEIVRQQWPNDLGKRSRLWKPDDIYDVLKKNKGKSEIRGIFLDMSKIKEVQLSAETFKKMHNLRIIQFYNSSDFPRVSNVTFHVCLKSLPDDLKFLRWDGFPQRSLPQYFCPENLVALEMPYSDLEQLWEGDQALPNLKRLNLRKSKKLIEVPDLSLSPNIEEIILSKCVSLVQVYSSSFLNDLNWLCLDRCTKLKSLNIPSNILSRSYGLVALNGCLNLETLLISSRTDVFRSYSCSRFDGILDRLCIHVCNDEMGLWTNDEGYKILDDVIEEDDPITFKSVNEFCWLDVSNCESLTSLPAELLNLKFLRRLNLSGCLKLEELPEIEETMENIMVLILDKTAIKELPSSLHRLVGLEELSLRSCKKLKTIPSSIGNLSKLLKLDLTYCESLETFPSSIFKLKLTKLHLRGCSMLRTFPEIPSNVNIGHLSSLTKISLQGSSSIVNLPESMAHLSSLKSLKLSDCRRLECIPKLPPNLNQLLAFDCPSIKRVVPSSTLKLLSDSKDGTFRFHFTNSQQLDASFLRNIGAEAWYKIIDDAYRSVFFCFPGSAVPGWFPYRCRGKSLTIRKVSPYLCGENRLIGFALCVVLRHEDVDDKGRGYTGLVSRLRFESDGQTHFLPNKLFGHVFYCKDQKRSFVHDHTFLWKYQLDLASIGNRLFHAHSFTLEIEVIDYFEWEILQPTVTVKEFAICPLFTKDNSIEEPNKSKAAH